MARTAVTVQRFSQGDTAALTETAVDPTNDHVVTFTNPSKGYIHVRNTYAGAKTVTLKAGDSDVARNASQGDQVISVAQNEVRIIKVDASRFLQNDGTINVDLEAAITGGIFAIETA